MAVQALEDLEKLKIDMKRPGFKPPKVYGDKLLKALLR
jgi:hypothetical protein